MTESWRFRARAIYERFSDDELFEHEARSSEALLREVAPATVELVDEALGLLKEMLDHATSVPLEERAAWEEVADVSFAGICQLREKRCRIRALTENVAAHEILAECASARRRLRKALEAFGDALLGHYGGLRGRARLFDSLVIRREYLALRKVLLAPVGAAPSAVTDYLKRSRDRITMALGSRSFVKMRARDRVILRALQGRVLQWLQGPRDSVDGRRLVGDLVGFAQIVKAISHREELVVHDTVVLSRITRELGSSSPDPRTVRALLMQIEGLDDDVDRLVERPTFTPDEVRGVVAAALRGRPRYGAA